MLVQAGRRGEEPRVLVRRVDGRESGVRQSCVESQGCEDGRESGDGGLSRRCLRTRRAFLL